MSDVEATPAEETLAEGETQPTEGEPDSKRQKTGIKPLRQWIDILKEVISICNDEGMQGRLMNAVKGLEGTVERIHEIAYDHAGSEALAEDNVTREGFKEIVAFCGTGFRLDAE
jgi:hypothetical protein